MLSSHLRNQYSWLLPRRIYWNLPIITSFGSRLASFRHSFSYRTSFLGGRIGQRGRGVKDPQVQKIPQDKKAIQKPQKGVEADSAWRSGDWNVIDLKALEKVKFYWCFIFLYWFLSSLFCWDGMKRCDCVTLKPDSLEIWMNDGRMIETIMSLSFCWLEMKGKKGRYKHDWMDENEGSRHLSTVTCTLFLMTKSEAC